MWNSHLHKIVLLVGFIEPSALYVTIGSSYPDFYGIVDTS